MQLPSENDEIFSIRAHRIRPIVLKKSFLVDD
jgi:hypothetical protein